jgi:Zyg-11 family protein
MCVLPSTTDESPTTCETFIKTGGLTLFIKILSKPECDSTVKTKILGLINNIAEVVPLRCHLMNEALINCLRLVPW